MFEREIRDMAIVPRWVIVRTIKPQFLAEHSYLVSMYTNDICVLLDLPKHVHLAALQYALWHDVDEIVSGDVSGPFKREAVKDKGHWKATAGAFMQRIFGIFQHRSGRGLPQHEQNIVQCVVKVADWLEAALCMGGEYQMGNQNVVPHFQHCADMAYKEADFLCDLLGLPATVTRGDTIPLAEKPWPRNLRDELYRLLEHAVNMSYRGQSKGPMMAAEMDPYAKTARVLRGY